MATRRLSDDPIRQAGGLNMQDYGDRNPIMNQDASGHDKKVSPIELTKILNEQQPAVYTFEDGYDFNEFTTRPGNPQTEEPPTKHETYPGGPIYIHTITNVREDDNGIHFTVTFTKSGTDEAGKAIAGYTANVRQFQDTVKQIAATGQELVDAAGSLNVAANAITAVSGQNPSGRRATKIERGTAFLAAAGTIVVAILSRGLSMAADANRGIKIIKAAEDIKSGEKIAEGANAAENIVGKLSAAESESLLNSATSTGRNGLSEAGRALQSHAAREGSWLAGRSAGGNAAANTAAARQILSEITAGGNVVRGTHPVWGNIITIRLPNGAGAVWKADGTFVTFLERYTPKP